MKHSAYVQLTKAQLLIFWRNPRVLMFSLLFPVLLMTALGTLLGNGGGITLSGVVIDEDRSAASLQVVKLLKEQPIVQWNEGGDSLPVALEALKRGDLQLVLVIPGGYGEAAADAARSASQSHTAQGQQTASAVRADQAITPASIEVYYDQTNQNAMQVGLPVIRQLADNASKTVVGYTPVVTTVEKGVQALDLQYIDFLVPGIVAMMIMNNNLNGVAAQISSWRERGILRRMQSTTLRAPTFIAAQITARLLMNGTQAALVIIIGHFFFGAQVNGSWLLLLALVLLGTLAFMSLGFIIAGLAKTPESAGPIAGLVSFPLLFVGGVFFPVKSMPELLQPLVKLLPITHLSSALRQVMNVGAGLAEVGWDAVLLCGWLAAGFLIASLVFKWE